LYKLFLNLLKKANLVFSYLCLDELYTFYGKKSNKVYIWSAVGITKTGKKFYFYFLSIMPLIVLTIRGIIMLG